MSPQNQDNDVINYGLESLYAVGDALGTPAIQQEIDYKTSEDKVERNKLSKQQPDIEFMAQWPDEAHRWWKQLKKVEQTSVLTKMSTRYGKPFVDRFLEETFHPTRRDVYDYYFGPGMGPIPEKIISYGYKIAQKDTTHDWWVNPMGVTIVRQREGLEKPKDDGDENLPLIEAQNYAEDFIQGKNKIIEQINQLMNNVANPQYPNLYKQFWSDFQIWQDQLNLVDNRVNNELKEEILLFNPDSMPQLERQIDKLKEIIRWKEQEWINLVHDLPIPSE